MSSDGLSKTVRDFVEKYLITSNGVRLSYPVRSAESEKLATLEQINTLISKRLIRHESLEEGDSIELVHDRLAQIALQHGQASQQLKKTQRQKQQQLRRRWVISVVVIVIVLIGFVVFMFNLRRV